MAVNNVLKLQYLSGGALVAVNFCEDEVYNVRVVEHQHTVLKRLLNRQPILHHIGPKWKEVIATISPWRMATYDNCETLKSVTEIMGLHLYKPNGTLAEDGIYVRIDPNLKTYNVAGYREASTPIILKFYEAQGGDAVPVDL